MTDDFVCSCPTPAAQYAQVVLAHGGGGTLMHRLIEQIFRPAFSNPLLDTQTDGATLESGAARLAFTTDSYVVTPLFFPGGDIGTLAIYGTVNDLAMCGARPRYLSCGFILEEGLPLATLERVVASMREAAAMAGVQIVTGDTKVVDRGRGDGLFINTAGIGSITHELTLGPCSVRPGDAILLNGDIGRHGMAIMAAREELVFENVLESDCAPLADPVLALLEAGLELHCLRDLTRGGLASGLVEIAVAAGLAIDIEEAAIPVRDDVQAACEILGFDPLYVANEGRMIVILPARDADRALAILRAHPLGQGATLIGYVADQPAGLVTMTTRIGAHRIVDMLSGEQLPRIC